MTVIDRVVESNRLEVKKIFALVVALDAQVPQERKPNELRAFKVMVDDLAGRNSPLWPKEDIELIAEALGSLSAHDYEDPNNIIHALAPVARERQKQAMKECSIELGFPDNPWTRQFAKPKI